MSKVRLPSARRFMLLLFVVAPIAAWFVVRPVRVVAPALAGISCPSASICLDDLSRRAVAEQLYSDGLAFVAAAVSPLAGTPRVIFCSTETCANSFGLGARSAVTVGAAGTVIGPRAWKPHYLRHELIHQLQAQRLGTVALLFKPSWFVEGMAYALSEDPRPSLGEPLQGYRLRFLAWYQAMGKGDLWRQAGAL